MFFSLSSGSTMKKKPTAVFLCCSTSLCLTFFSLALLKSINPSTVSSKHSGWSPPSFPSLLVCQHLLTFLALFAIHHLVIAALDATYTQESVQLSFSDIKSGISNTSNNLRSGKVKDSCIHVPVFLLLHRNISHCRPQSLNVLRTILWWKVSMAALSRSEI